MGNRPGCVAVEVLQPQRIPISRGEVFVLLLASDGSAHRITNFPDTKRISLDCAYLEVRICTAQDEELFVRNVYDHYASVFVPLKTVFEDEDKHADGSSKDGPQAKLVACWCGLDPDCLEPQLTTDAMVRQFEVSKLQAGRLNMPKVGLTLQLVDDMSKGQTLACGIQPVPEVSRHCSESVRHLQHVVQSLHRVDNSDANSASTDVLEREIAVLRSSNQSLRKQYEVEISYLMSLLKTRNGGSRQGTPRKTPRQNGDEVATLDISDTANVEKERFARKILALEEEIAKQASGKEEALKLLNGKVQEGEELKSRVVSLERERDLLRDGVGDVAPQN